MGKEIIIQVIGLSNTGKTAIFQEIVDILRRLNLNVEFDAKQDLHDENFGRRTQEQQLQVLDAIKLKDTKIIVKEVREIKLL